MNGVTVGLCLVTVAVLLPSAFLKPEQLDARLGSFVRFWWVLPAAFGALWFGRRALAAGLGQGAPLAPLFVGLLSIGAAGFGLRLLVHARKRGLEAESRRILLATLAHATPGLLLVAALLKVAR